MAGTGNGEEATLFKYMERVEKRFDRLERDFIEVRAHLGEVRVHLGALRGDFRRFGKQVAKILAAHNRRLTALERRAA